MTSHTCGRNAIAIL